ncbi:hypothetical protein CYY_007881 [Polysphondylium violaceum]|uniref:Uncharacterized protein n=1 Tax=Polysphondylium violaceum TaxID=133409 RepID=A0A8J4PQ51_9MYCE|nr:hypothetical protein CYY_007881 [Polysphondylium violaceum]
MSKQFSHKEYQEFTDKLENPGPAKVQLSYFRGDYDCRSPMMVSTDPKSATSSSSKLSKKKLLFQLNNLNSEAIPMNK